MQIENIIKNAIDKSIPTGFTYDIDHYKCFMMSDTVKGKNYIVYTDDNKLKMFGTAFKNARYEKFGRDFMKEIAMLLVEEKLEDINKTCMKYYNAILSHSLPIEDISRTQEVKRSYSDYSMNKVMTDKFYEMINNYGLMPSLGDRIRFYQTINGDYKPASLYDKKLPDEDVKSLLESLNKYCERFNGILSAEEYRKYFPEIASDTVSQYKYVDVNWHDKNGMFSKWRRISLDSLQNFIDKNAKLGREVFCSVNRFKERQREDNEKFILPLYFDLDGNSLIDVFNDASKIVRFFISKGLARNFIKVYFSGSKGLHIIIEPEIFSLSPNAENNYKIQHVRRKIADELKLTTLCTSSEGKRKMLRCVNTINLKSGLYKIELLTVMPNIKAVVELAKSPQDIQQNRIFPPVESMIKWFNDSLSDYKKQEQNYEVNTGGIDFIPTCIKDILVNGLQVEGTRHRVTLLLASFFKSAGMEVDEAIEYITAWAVRQDKSSSTEQEIVTDTENTVISIYKKKTTRFTCAFIFSLPWYIECGKTNCKLWKGK